MQNKFYQMNDPRNNVALYIGVTHRSLEDQLRYLGRDKNFPLYDTLIELHALGEKVVLKEVDEKELSRQMKNILIDYDMMKISNDWTVIPK